MAYAEYVVLCGDATNISKAADCAICIEHFENENEVRVLPCLHPFHLRCIDPWLTAHSAACPLCKQEARSKGS
ncbi:hypothetical protein GQ42DRAFT_169007 [Ramicandelaber brevisporus]|nr:hypothetical protein GQ42DRAFT_169007 [Ramicandelaber brevisporus]